MRKIIAAVLIMGLAFAGYHFFMHAKGASGGGMPGMGAMPVTVAPVLARDMEEWDTFEGKLEAVDRVEIRPRVAGTIEAIRFSEGQKVKKGDLLFVIDPKPYEAALAAAKAADVYANAEWQRARKLLPVKAISRHEYDDKKNAAENAHAQLVKAELDLGYTQVRAPIAGRISRAEITLGNLVSAGGEAPLLTTIVSLDPIFADFDVDEQSYVRYLAAAKGRLEALNASPVRLSLSGNEEFPYEGHVRSFDNELNPKSGTVRVRALFKNESGALIPGLYARIRISGAGKQKRLLVRENAVSTDQSRKLVFVVGADNKVEGREVKLGPVTGDLRIIREGLKEGENIVVGGIQRVRPGAQVVPQMTQMEAGPVTETPEEKH